MIPDSYMGHGYPVLRIIDHHQGRRSLYLPRAFDLQPGQFVMLWLPGVDEKPFSASDVGKDEIEITICAKGPATQALLEVKEGALLGLRGPFGTGFRLQERSLLVGGGIGAAPIRYLARELARRGLDPTVLVGARTERELIFTQDFVAMGALVFTDDGSHGQQGLVTDALPELLACGGIDTVCACGPEPMLLAIKDLCEQRGVDYQLAFERYMKCGMGICGSCSLDGSGIRVCVEGPVLGPTELAKVTELGLAHRGATGVRDVMNN